MIFWLFHKADYLQVPEAIVIERIRPKMILVRSCFRFAMLLDDILCPALLPGRDVACRHFYAECRITYFLQLHSARGHDTFLIRFMFAMPAQLLVSALSRHGISFTFDSLTPACLSL